MRTSLSVEVLHSTRIHTGQSVRRSEVLPSDRRTADSMAPAVHRRRRYLLRLALTRIIRPAAHIHIQSSVGQERLSISVRASEPIDRRSRQRHPEHQELVVVIQASIVRFAEGDALRGNEVVVRLPNQRMSTTPSKYPVKARTALKRK